ncbi:MAG: hypothetical protein IKN48_04760 [Bacteroidaceae bacterium]|nr:hypothetical protein [Bacteroidaceae bacterium]
MATNSYEKFKEELPYSITEITSVISKCSRKGTYSFSQKFIYSVMLFDVLNMNLPFTSNLDGLSLYVLLNTYIDVERARMLIDTKATLQRSKEEKAIGDGMEHICRETAHYSNYKHPEVADRATWFYTKCADYIKTKYRFLKIEAIGAAIATRATTPTASH